MERNDYSYLNVMQILFLSISDTTPFPFSDTPIVILIKVNPTGSASRNMRSAQALVYDMLQQTTNAESVPIYIENRYVIFFRTVHKKPLRMVFEAKRTSKIEFLDKDCNSGRLQGVIVIKLNKQAETMGHSHFCKKWQITIEADYSTLQLLHRATGGNFPVKHRCDDWDERCPSGPECLGECVARDMSTTVRTSPSSTDEQKPIIAKAFGLITDHKMEGTNTKYGGKAIYFMKHIQNNRDKVDLSIVRNEKGYTLLHAAILENTKGIVTALFEAGLFKSLFPLKVSGEISNYKGMTATNIAMKLKYTPIQDELLKLNDIEESMSMCHIYARQGDARRLAKLVRRHRAHINHPALDGSTPLYWAITSGNIEAVTCLINAKADTNVLSQNGDTMLIRAVSLGYCSIGEYLLENCDVDPDTTGAERKTALHHAIEFQTLDIIQMLLRLDATVPTAIISQLAITGNLKIFKHIQKNHTLDFNFQDHKGKTALFHALERNHISMCTFILSSKPKLDIKDRRERTIFHAAVESGNPELIDMLIPYICNQSKRVVDELINGQDKYLGSERCFLVRGRDHGNLAFHYVEVDRLYINKFRQITKSGGSLDVATYGTVILSGWGAHPAPEIIKEIDERYGIAKITPDTPNDLNPLLLAILKDKPQCALRLIEHGANVTTKDAFGNTSLHLACMRGQLDVVKALTRRAADVNATDDHGRKPLQAAQMNGHTNIINFLNGETFMDRELQYVAVRFHLQ